MSPSDDQMEEPVILDGNPEILDWPGTDNSEPRYCFCNQGDYDVHFIQKVTRSHIFCTILIFHFFLQYLMETWWHAMVLG